MVDANSVAVLETGATATLACFKWLGRRNAALDKWVIPPAQPHPALAGFKFGKGRLGEVRFAAEISVGIAGGRGKFAAFLLAADIPLLLRQGALGALGGWQVDSNRNALSVVFSGEERNLLVTGSTNSVSYTKWGASVKRPELPNGGLRSSYAEDDLRQFDPQNFSGVGSSGKRRSGGFALVGSEEKNCAIAC